DRTQGQPLGRVTQRLIAHDPQAVPLRQGVERLRIVVFERGAAGIVEVADHHHTGVLADLLLDGERDAAEAAVAGPYEGAQLGAEPLGDRAMRLVPGAL